MNTIKFKAHAVRSVTSPSNDDITTYFVWVNFKDLPQMLPMDVNPREPKMTTSVAKQLIAAVNNPNTDFDINNRGIVITSKSFKFTTHDSMVTLDFDNNTTCYGILDGGHTYKAITDHHLKLDDTTQKFVRLEVLVGKDLDVSALADARNTSVQVSDIALFELDDKFEMIKDAVKEESFCNDIAFKDNETKRIPVIEFLKLMFAFNISKYPDDSGAPVSAYSGKANVFKDYKKEYGVENNIYCLLAKEIPVLVNLYETIEIQISDKYQEFKKENGKNSKFGRVRGIEGSGEFQTLFSKKKMEYAVSTGYILPIFGAFRALIKIDEASHQIVWQFNPIEVWEKAGTRLVQNTFETDTNPQLAGKNKILWQSNYRIVDGVKKDLMLKELISAQK